ncbi:MAG: hypothetical protein ABI333_04880 [bacterium]
MAAGSPGASRATGARIRRETWIKIAELGALIFVVVLVAALLATRGCET